jgi:hypothetical protein
MGSTLRQAMPIPSPAVRALAALALAACTAFTALLAGCAATKDPAVSEEASRPAADKVLARLLAKGDMDKVQKAVDSLAVSKEPAEREIAAYWKAVAWLYRDEPDSALTILEANQAKWTGSLRKVHSAVFLRLAREASAARIAAHARHEETVKVAPDKSMQDRIESLQKETGDLRAEIGRLETEKEKYQKLIKDLETIR